MEKIKYSEMSNTELKLHIESLSNIFESKKIALMNICDEMKEVERQYLSAKNELNIRKNLYT
jgi:hypothetical protein